MPGAASLLLDMPEQGFNRRDAKPAPLHPRSPEPTQRCRPENGNSNPTRGSTLTDPPLMQRHQMPIVAGEYYFEALMDSDMELRSPTCHALQAVETDGHTQHSAAFGVATTARPTGQELVRPPPIHKRQSAPPSSPPISALISPIEGLSTRQDLSPAHSLERCLRP